MHVSLTKQQGLAAHRKPAGTTPHTTVTTSTQNPLIMASSSSASNWECGACAFSNKWGKYYAISATPCPKCQALLVALAADVDVHPAVVAKPAVVVKATPSAPLSGSLVGTPVAVVGVSTTVVAAPAAAVSIAVATAIMS
jgi:hypothetical protein